VKNIKNTKRYQLLTYGIIIICLIGVLIINSNNVTADNSLTSLKTVQAANTEVTKDVVIDEYTSSAFPSMIKLIGALALVIGCIYLALFLFKKFLGKKYTGNKANNILEILETTYVGPKKTVSLIRVADKSVLVGTTDSQISVLSELNEEQTKKILNSMVTEEKKENFINLFQTASDKLKELSLKRKTKAALEV
jgi:flagellar biosynthetic protein FliO